MWLNIYLYASAMLWVEVPDDVRHTECKCLLAICFQPAESWSSNTAGFREMENQMPIAVTRKGPVYIKTWIKNKPKQASKPWHGSELKSTVVNAPDPKIIFKTDIFFKSQARRWKNKREWHDSPKLAQSSPTPATQEWNSQPVLRLTPGQQQFWEPDTQSWRNSRGMRSCVRRCGLVIAHLFLCKHKNTTLARLLGKHWRVWEQVWVLLVGMQRGKRGTPSPAPARLDQPGS